MRSGIGPKGQVIFLGSVPEMIEDDSGLHSRNSAFGIEFDDVCHVLGEIEHDGHVAALPGKRSASAAAKHRSAVLAANGDGCDYVFSIARDYDCDRDLPII